jgi:hypothetical protein
MAELLRQPGGFEGPVAIAVDQKPRELSAVRRVLVTKPVLGRVVDLIAEPVPTGASPLVEHWEEVLFGTGAEDLDGLLAPLLADLDETGVAHRARINPFISHGTGRYRAPGSGSEDLPDPLP